MAFDGITVAALAKEIDETITGGRISKIIQPESDELILTIKNNSKQYRLLLSSGASLPLVFLTQNNKQAPMNAPNFCMLLRKHLNGGRILSVEQPGLERILILTVEHRDEMGDLRSQKLIIEVMGKHSNIILVNENDVIIDSIKRISCNISSVREVLPGREYFIPQTQQKADPLTISEQEFHETVFSKEMPLFKALYLSLTGLSPLIAEEICCRAGLDPDSGAAMQEEPSRVHLYHTFAAMMEDVRNGAFKPEVIYKEKEPFEYAAFSMAQFSNLQKTEYESISALIETYYAEKELRTRIRQRSSDLRRVVQTALERNGRTLSLQEKQLHDTEKRDKYRIYGELLNTYGYGLTGGEKELEALNYYTNETIRIPLDPMLSASQNSKKYFERYNKLKRTAEALQERIEDTRADVQQLENIANALDIARDETDLQEIRRELVDYGYIHKHTGVKGARKQAKSAPLHYISSDGYDMYVGKNNYQNEEVTFHIANGSDWWFHANDIPGSHVIVKGKGGELPDRTFEEAGRLAAYYSKSRMAPKVEIDYTLRKNLHKPTGGRPGFVIYHTNYSLIAEPDISDIQEA
ncbi:MAG: NFACT RNA binding domain-containing protein [Eubacteriales bacterium]|nr:NFACT RNA binding domain-containing protein [Eubacteriales bacterium]